MPQKVYINAHFDIVPPHREEVLGAFKTLAEETRKEPGCISYILTQSEANPLSFVVNECWASEEAFAAHLQAPHFKEFQKAVENMRSNRITHKLKQVI